MSLTCGMKTSLPTPAEDTASTVSDELSEDESTATGETTRSRSSSKRTKSVSFGTVESRLFETIQGHPDFTVANPVSLGWHCYGRTKALSVDQYEARRPEPRSFFIPPTERKRIIKKSQRKVNAALGLGHQLRHLLPNRFFGSSSNKKRQA